MTPAQKIKRKAIELGFDIVGITDASPIEAEQISFFTDWLNKGYAAKMKYMHDNFDKRINPAALLEDAQSVIVVGLNYKPPLTRNRPQNADGPTGYVSQYARYEDYHIFIKRLLRQLADFIATTIDDSAKFKICVDSAPLAERSLAVRAGLGFIGKNHMLINPALGAQIFLGEIITNLQLPTDNQINGSCLDCDKCISACPTGALRNDGWLDARRCISYLTIEHTSDISPDLAEKLGDRIFGCDECVLTCPYQQKAIECRNRNFKFYSNRANIDLNNILQMTETQFDTEFDGSVIKRSGLKRIKRNAKICIENLTKQNGYGNGEH